MVVHRSQKSENINPSTLRKKETSRHRRVDASKKKKDVEASTNIDGSTHEQKRRMTKHQNIDASTHEKKKTSRRQNMDASTPPKKETEVMKSDKRVSGFLSLSVWFCRFFEWFLRVCSAFDLCFVHFFLLVLCFYVKFCRVFALVCAISPFHRFVIFLAFSQKCLNVLEFLC